jgi:DNA-binding GntR family transcriptional regulator
VRSIRELIVNGYLRPGDKIDQEELVRRFGVSRVPLREALVQLESESVIENIPRRGSYVRQLTPKDLEDQYLVLGRVAGIAAARAAEARDPAAIAKVVRLLQKLEAASSAVTGSLPWREFYLAVTRAGASGWLLRALQMTEDSIPLSLYTVMRAEAHNEWQESALASARKLTEALKNEDSALAEQSMHEYLSASTKSTKSALLARGYWSPDGVSGAPESVGALGTRA